MAKMEDLESLPGLYLKGDRHQNRPLPSELQTYQPSYTIQLYSFTLHHFTTQVLQILNGQGRGGGEGGRSKRIKDDDFKTAIRKQLHRVTGQCCICRQGFQTLPGRKVGGVQCASCTHILKTGQDEMTTPVNITEVLGSS